MRNSVKREARTHEEFGHVVHIAFDDDPRTVCTLMLLNFGGRDGLYGGLGSGGRQSQPSLARPDTGSCPFSNPASTGSSNERNWSIEDSRDGGRVSRQTREIRQLTFDMITSSVGGTVDCGVTKGKVGSSGEWRVQVAKARIVKKRNPAKVRFLSRLRLASDWLSNEKFITLSPLADGCPLLSRCRGRVQVASRENLGPFEGQRFLSWGFRSVSPVEAPQIFAPKVSDQSRLSD